MGYVQMTLTDWVEMKKSLERDLAGVQESFVRIGYTLRRIEEQKLYEQDGYKSIAEFAKKEYDLSPSTVSRFIAINEKYSVGGYSDQLRPEFARLGSSKLSEMLSLPDSDLQMIQPETPRESIRELKQFNKSTPSIGEADDIRELVREFLSDNTETVKALRAAGIKEKLEQGAIKELAEIINPGGNRSYRRGLYFLMMYENRITVKKYGSTPQDMTWEEFLQIASEEMPEAEPEEAAELKTPVSEEQAAEELIGGEQGKEPDSDDQAEESAEQTENEKEAEEYREFGEQEASQAHEEHPEQAQSIEPDPAEDPERVIEPEQAAEAPQGAEPAQITEPEIAEKTPVEEAEETTEKEEIAPAQKSEEIRQNQGFEAPEEPETEVVERPFGSRKEYLNALTVEAAADYLVLEYIRDHLNATNLRSKEAMERWLLEKVDDRGKTYD